LYLALSHLELLPSAAPAASAGPHAPASTIPARTNRFAGREKTDELYAENGNYARKIFRQAAHQPDGAAVLRPARAFGWKTRDRWRRKRSGCGILLILTRIPLDAERRTGFLTSMHWSAVAVRMSRTAGPHLELRRMDHFPHGGEP
jgi:hypothetical protein